MLTLPAFTTDFFEKTKDWDWEVEGFVDSKGYVYPIDTDTKVISTVFERLSSPVIRSVAKVNNYLVETANQTTYPDFTLTHYKDEKVFHRIAIDVKTTYLSDTMLFTLGGYNSFLRNNSKNILHPYDTYNEHWIIGFIYAQKVKFDEYDLENMPSKGDVPCPYSNVTVFVRKKHEISGIRAGSGNTKNIGSIKLKDPKHFATAGGPFTVFTKSKEACDHYWRNYERYIELISTQGDLKAHPDFQQFL